MPAIFVVDDSAKVPSRLVQRLMAAEYHVLCLADCRTALESMRCIRPDLVIVDVAVRSRAAAEGLLRLLGRDDRDRAGGGPRPALVPVMVVGATPEDFRVLSELLTDGEVVPAARSSPEEVVRRVGRYVEPSHLSRERPAAGRAGPWPAAADPPEPPATRRPGVPTTSPRAWRDGRQSP